jgi:hypothetical protein
MSLSSRPVGAVDDVERSRYHMESHVLHQRDGSWCENSAIATSYHCRPGTHVPTRAVLSLASCTGELAVAQSVLISCAGFLKGISQVSILGLHRVNHENQWRLLLWLHTTFLH